MDKKKLAKKKAKELVKEYISDNITDPYGCWTGRPDNPYEVPVQDADDL